MTDETKNDETEASKIQLGFSVEFEDDDHRMLAGHHLPAWEDWDGGQLGGRPTWLNPKDIPKNNLTCTNCDGPLVFVCQLYCPCDEININAFHRSFYAFACPKKSCSECTTGTIRVLRTQLPQENPYYPNEKDDCWAMHIPESWDVNLCKVCGQRGPGKCPVQGEYFCCRDHQKEYKKYVFNKKDELSDDAEPFLPSVMTASEMVVEEEPSGAKDSKLMAEKAANTMFENDNDSDDELDKNMEQSDLNAMTGAGPETVTKDPETMKFYDRINSIPDVNTQCLRYLRWPEKDQCRLTSSPLWIRSDCKPDDESIPPCERCGAARRFEFQLMPQMLHYLLKNREAQNTKDAVSEKDTEAVRAATSIMEQSPPEQVPPDLASTTQKAIEVARQKIMSATSNAPSWGTVSVYTCTASCGGLDTNLDEKLGAYIEEYAWKQPSLD